MQEQQPANDNLFSSKGVNKSQERRLQFIDFRLRWEGRINRTDLTEFFGISIPQASLDIAKYSEIAPSNLVYDRSSKTYVSTPQFCATYQRSSAHRYLSELFASKTGIIDPATSFIGSAPEIDWTPSPWRTISESAVDALVKAIRENLAVRIRYQSMSTLDESLRLLSPHALCNDGFRWHVRAYCHNKQSFRDFVIARILDINGFEPNEVDPLKDVQWHTFVTLILAPHPDLSLAKKRVIEIDYGMIDGEASLTCRQALLFYTLKRLGLYERGSFNPVTQQIILKNREEIQPFIDELT